jgi:hypothetical protein
MPDETAQPASEPGQSQPSPEAPPSSETTDGRSTADNAEPQTQTEPAPTENPISEPNPVPSSPQEPTPDTSLPPKESTPTEVPSVAPEAPKEAESAIPVKDHNPANEPFDEAQDKPLSQPVETTPTSEIPSAPEPQLEPNPAPEIPENPPETAPQQPTAQLPPNEPIDLAEKEKTKQRQENLKLANEKRQSKKREKIDEILNLFAGRQTVTNDEVEKLLHISDATATRYLQILENENRIRQVGKTGKGVKYEKI